MNTDANFPAKVFDGIPFDDFYDRALPVVSGYVLRLCGGDLDEAWDSSWIVCGATLHLGGLSGVRMLAAW